MTKNSVPDAMAESLTWEGFGQACDELASRVRDSGFRPRAVVAVPRGGLMPAGALAYALGVGLTDVVDVELYAEGHQPIPDLIRFAPLLEDGSVVGVPLLVVDDLTDSGRTLGLVMRLLRGFGADVRSAVLFSKPNTVFPPDYCWRRTSGWVRFPWSPAGQ